MFAPAIDSNKPILGGPLPSKDPFDFGYHAPSSFVLAVGAVMVFRYDEGCPTELTVTVDSIAPMAAGASAGDFPRPKPEAVKKSNVAAVAAVMR